MVTGVRTLGPKRRFEAGIIRESRHLYQKESYEEKLRGEIEHIIRGFEKNKRYDVQKIRDLFDQFISSVENILKELEMAKRNAESEEFKNLQELQQLISAEKNIKISRRLKEIEERVFFGVFKYMDRIATDERRLSGNNAPRGYFLKKMSSDRALLRNMGKKDASILRNRTENHLRTIISKVRELRGKVITNELESEIIGILKQYHENFERDLVIEVDIELEEARKLHQIAKYIRFAKILKMPEYVTKLEILMKKTDYFVEQDAADSKQIRKIMVRLFGLSKQLEFTDTAQLQIFEDIITTELQLQTDSGILIGGTRYIRPKTFNKKGVVMLPGIFGTRKQLDLLSKRLAYQGYGVLTIDLPSQAESGGEWRLGLMSEFIFTATRYWRGQGVRSVGVIGHSAGAVASMFAALSYNTKIENEIYKIFAEYFDLTDQLSKYDPSKPEQSGVINKIEEEIVKAYTIIKQCILASLKSGRFNQGRIDSFVLLAPPPRFQEVMPPKITHWLGGQKQKRVKWVIDNFINNPLKRNLLRSKKPVEYGGPNKNSTAAEFLFLRMPDIKDFMEYIASVNNPCDYANLLNKFRDKSGFIRTFLGRFVEQTPKLFIYGKWDSLLKGFTPKLLLTQGLSISKKRQESIDSVYSLMGNHRTVVVPNTSHFLNEGDLMSINLREEGIKDSRVVREILSFLGSTL